VLVRRKEGAVDDLNRVFVKQANAMLVETQTSGAYLTPSGDALGMQDSIRLLYPFEVEDAPTQPVALSWTLQQLSQNVYQYPGSAHIPNLECDVAAPD